MVVRGVNDDEIVDFAAFGRAKGVELRFIEWMPLDGGGQWSQDQVVPASEIIDDHRRRVAAGRSRRAGASGDSAPAESYRYADGGRPGGRDRQRDPVRSASRATGSG